MDSFTTLGYTLDTHDMKLLPNGHALLFGTEVRTVDMSALVPGGKTAASVTGDVIQEIDANKRLVFEWHTFDHIPITNSFYDLTQQTIDYAHINAVSIDPTDNNLLASLRTTSEIVKINRQTGEVMWRLGGKANEFTFVGEHEENAPYYTVGQHDIHRLPNGDLLYFDNGNISGGGITPSDRTYSRAVEYHVGRDQQDCHPGVGIPAHAGHLGPVHRLGQAVPQRQYAHRLGLRHTHQRHHRHGGLARGRSRLRDATSDSPGQGHPYDWQRLGQTVVEQPGFDPLALTSRRSPSGQTYDSPDVGVSVTVNDLIAPAANDAHGPTPFGCGALSDVLRRERRKW